WPGRTLGVVVACAALLPPTLTLVAFDRTLARADTRELAGQWLASHEPRSTHLSQGFYARVHALERTPLTARRASVATALPLRVPTLFGDTVDWRRLVARGRAGWAAVAGAAVGRSASRLDPRGADFVCQGQVVLACGRYGRTEGLAPLDQRCFKLDLVISPG